MLLVQWDDVIEYFAARTSDPALGDSVLPGASSTGSNGSNATGFQELENIATEFAIPVEQDVPVGAGKRKSLAELLHDPIGRRVCRDIEVQDSPSIVRDDKKAVEGAKRQARNGEKSNAPISSRWLLRKASHCWALPSSGRGFSC
jgi:hypothetical protein